METRFRVDPGTCASAHNGYEAIPANPAPAPKQPWKFVGDFERMVGDDSEPDPQFFVETWTLGMAAAVENFQQRRRGKSESGKRKREFEQIGAFVPIPFVQEFTFDYSSSIESLPSKPENKKQPARDRYAPSEELRHPFTLQTACRLLGVLETSTQAQIKAAYRRKVSQFHPDRLGCTSEEERRAATERMAAINEAYRLLRTRITD